MSKKSISVEVTVQSPLSRVWECWTDPKHIVNWAFASSDWEVPAAKNDFRVGGRFVTTMAAKDKSQGFDFSGVYTAIKQFELIEYDMDDARHARVEFFEIPQGVTVKVTFDLENENPEELQRNGWQAISDNFKKYTESITK